MNNIVFDESFVDSHVISIDSLIAALTEGRDTLKNKDGDLGERVLTLCQTRSILFGAYFAQDLVRVSFPIGYGLHHKDLQSSEVVRGRGFKYDEESIERALVNSKLFDYQQHKESGEESVSEMLNELEGLLKSLKTKKRKNA